jgi:long-chain acyl-CoA synthetase
MPGTIVRVVDIDEGLHDMPPNQVGELIVKGPQVMLGYWNHPEETAHAIRDGWLYTGDIVYMDEDGYLFVVDRKKDMAIIGGYNVFPSEIDEVLYEYPKIKEAVALAIPHTSRGEALKAFIVPKPGETITVPELVAFCRQKLASYKVPKLFEFREELPKSAVGKILRRALREEEAQKLKIGVTDDDTMKIAGEAVPERKPS